jgi:hypothetical protein
MTRQKKLAPAQDWERASSFVLGHCLSNALYAKMEARSRARSSELDEEKGLFSAMVNS